MKKLFIIFVLICSLFMFSEIVNASEFMNSMSILEVKAPEAPNFDFGTGSMSCSQLLGPGLTKVLNFAIDVIRIVGIIAAVVMGMITLVDPVIKGDKGAFDKAVKKCIWIAVSLMLIVLFPLLVRVIGRLFGFDISCIF